MPISEAKKRANAKYQAKTIASLACRVKIEEAEQFKSICENAGTTSNATLRAFVYSCIKSGAPAPAAPQQAPQQQDGLTVTIQPEDRDKMDAHLELYGLDKDKFIHRAINTQITNDLNAKTLGMPMEREVDSNKRLIPKRDSQEGV